MPGIIDDEVGHVIYPCKTARTFSHLPLRGIVPPPPFRLIIKTHCCYLRTTLCVSLSALNLYRQNLTCRDKSLIIVFLYDGIHCACALTLSIRYCFVSEFSEGMD